MYRSSRLTSSMLQIEKVTLCVTTVICLLCFSCEAFTFSSTQVKRIRNNDPQSIYVSNAALPLHSKCSLLIRKLKDDDEDDDDDGDEYIDDTSLGDWRKFRMNLSESGISSVSSSSSSMVTDGYIEEGTDNKIDDDEDSISPDDATINRKRPKSVSKQNEKLLMKQSKTLAEEYIADVWAHESPKVRSLSNNNNDNNHGELHWF